MNTANRFTPSLCLLLLASACAHSAESEASTAPPQPQAGGEAPPSLGVEENPSSSIAPEPAVVLPGLSDSQQSAVSEFDQDFEPAREELGDTLHLSGGVDCDLAAELRDRICQLAERICEISEEHAHPALDERCATGTNGCESARGEVDGHCS